MKYYIAADGGGTKILSVLYDENLNIVNTVRHTGSGITKDKEQTKAEITEALTALIPSYVTEIEALDYSIVAAGGLYVDILKSLRPVKDVRLYNEGETPLAASGSKWGIVAQAGTGSDAYINQPDSSFIIGGWGFILGDEGSGYDIGLQSLKAATYSFDGRGERTVMLDMIMKAWEIKDNFYESVVFKVARSSDYRGLIAALPKITSEAARLGDRVAISVYEKAGRELALQVKAGIKKLGGSWVGPIVTSGGAWKGSPHMRRAFDESICAEYPNAVIKYPEFEPVVGCVLMRRYSLGEAFEDIKDKLCESFKQFIY